MTTGEACRVCGHEFGLHGLYWCNGSRMSGGPSGIRQTCSCPGFTTEKPKRR